MKHEPKMNVPEDPPCCHRGGLPSDSSVYRAHVADIHPLVAWYRRYALAITLSDSAPHVHLLQTQIRAILNNAAYGPGALGTRPGAHGWIRQIRGTLLDRFAELSDALQALGERPLPLHLLDEQAA